MNAAHDSPLLTLALRLAPASDRAWLEDMRLELPFLPSRLRWRWGLAALGLALRWRLEQLARPLRHPGPGLQTGLATLLTAALVLVLVVVPQGSPLPAPARQALRAAPPGDTLAEPAPSFDESAELAAPQSAPVAAAGARMQADEAEAAGASIGVRELHLAGPTAGLVARRGTDLSYAAEGKAPQALRLERGARLELPLPVTLELADAGALRLAGEPTPLGADGERLLLHLDMRP